MRVAPPPRACPSVPLSALTPPTPRASARCAPFARRTVAHRFEGTSAAAGGRHDQRLLRYSRGEVRTPCALSLGQRCCRRQLWVRTRLHSRNATHPHRDRLPDLGITTMNDVVEDARRITRYSVTWHPHVLTPIQRHHPPAPRRHRHWLRLLRLQHRSHHPGARKWRLLALLTSRS